MEGNVFTCDYGHIVPLSTLVYVSQRILEFLCWQSNFELSQTNDNTFIFICILVSNFAGTELGHRQTTDSRLHGEFQYQIEVVNL